MSVLTRLYPLVLLVGIAACGGVSEEGNGPTMQPGNDCLNCHSSGRNGFSAAGTVYVGAADTTGVSGVTVEITDAAGKKETLNSNSAGNFYTSASLTLPFKISVTRNGRTTTMSSNATSGGCNSCHVRGGAAGAHVMAP